MLFYHFNDFNGTAVKRRLLRIPEVVKVTRRFHRHCNALRINNSGASEMITIDRSNVFRDFVFGRITGTCIYVNSPHLARSAYRYGSRSGTGINIASARHSGRFIINLVFNIRNADQCFPTIAGKTEGNLIVCCIEQRIFISSTVYENFRIGRGQLRVRNRLYHKIRFMKITFFKLGLMFLPESIGAIYRQINAFIKHTNDRLFVFHL